jgi:hypothetical protein
MADPASYFQDVMTHYQVLLPAEILVLLTIAVAAVFWRRIVRPSLDQRFKSYRLRTISSLQSKIAWIDSHCSDDQIRLRRLLYDAVDTLTSIISMLRA